MFLGQKQTSNVAAAMTCSLIALASTSGANLWFRSQLLEEAGLSGPLAKLGSPCCFSSDPCTTPVSRALGFDSTTSVMSTKKPMPSAINTIHKHKSKFLGLMVALFVFCCLSV